MDEKVKQLRTPKECEIFARNAERLGRKDLGIEARRFAVQLRAKEYGAESEAELEALQAIYAYEQVLARKHSKNVRATRTWPMVERHGVIGAVERAVNRSSETKGYRALLDMGMEDFAFEAVILRHPEVFSDAAIAQSEERLKLWRSS